MNEQRGIAGYNPLVGFVFFAGAIFLGMFFVHPVFLGAAAALSCAYYLSLKGKKGLKLIGLLLCVFIAISLINPLFNTLGDTVLFTYFGGRRFTLEALYYGMATGAMFFCIMLWFASYNIVMTSDKFIYLFGALAPSISLILTMVLRLVPNFKRELVTITGARRGIGKDAGAGRKRGMENIAPLLSAMASWALEGAVITSDSMRSRGYGLPGRTSFCIYRFGKRDAALLAALLGTISVVILCAAAGAAAVTYVPAVQIPKMGVCSYTGIVGYAAFLTIPFIMNVAEEIKWRILRSRI